MYNESALGDLCIDGGEAQSPALSPITRRTTGSPRRSGGGSVRRPPKVQDDASVASAESNRTQMADIYRESVKKMEIDMQRKIAESLRKVSERDEERFVKSLKGVEESTQFLDTLDETLKMLAEAKHNKVRKQYEDWNEQVHGVIQEKIHKQLSKMDAATINERHRGDLEKFLDITNRKSAIFRDIIIESEYDPLEPNRRAIKARTGTQRLKDPVKMLIHKHQEESQMVSADEDMGNKVLDMYGVDLPAIGTGDATLGGTQRGEGAGKTQRAVRSGGSSSGRGGGSSSGTRSLTYGPIHGREVLPIQDWASGKIDATPHGIAAKVNAQMEKGFSTTRDTGGTFSSAVFFDDYRIPRGKSVSDAEMPRGKRINERKVGSNVFPA